MNYYRICYIFTSLSEVCDRFVVAVADVEVRLCDETGADVFGFGLRQCLS